MSIYTVPYRLSNYSDYLAQISALIGVDSGDLQTPEYTILNQGFNRALRKFWETQAWTELSPINEVRFPQNLFTYPNDLTQTAYWTNTNLVAASNAFNNPLDYRQTATSLLETATNGVHSFSQTIGNIIPNTTYTVSGYVRPNGRTYFVGVVNDGNANTATFLFSLVQPSATVVLSANTGVTNPSANVTFVGNGFYFVTITFTSSASAVSSPVQTFYLANTSAGNTSYAGTTSSGIYAWGFTAYQMQSLVPASYYIPFTQLGETAMDMVNEVYSSDPGAGLNPKRVNYNTTPLGLEIIGPSSIGPVWLNYRPQRPLYQGSTFNASITYSVGQTIYFTSAGATTSGQSNYYTCTVATTAGQSPDTTPASWQPSYIPYIALPYCVYNAYADWLQAEGQAAKAAGMYAYAQTCMDDENDRMERQAGNIMPWRVNTHLTSQKRGMGYQNQTNVPNGILSLN